MSEDEKEPCLVADKTEDCEFKIGEDEKQPCLVNKHESSDEVLNSVKSDDENEPCGNGNTNDNDFDSVLNAVKTVENEPYLNEDKADINVESHVEAVQNVEINDIVQEVESLSCESTPESDCKQIPDECESSSDASVRETRAKEKVRFPMFFCHM